MNEKTLKTMCKEKNLDFDLVVYNIGHRIQDLRLYKGEIFKPWIWIGSKPKYQYLAQYEIKLEDCV